MKDIKTLLLVMLSVGLVGTWVYHLYDKTQYTNHRKEIFIKDSIAVAEAVQDSLRKIYATSLNNLDQQLSATRSGADSLKTELNVKLGEINRLRSEINGILRNRGASQSDMTTARKKIAELQVLVDELRGEKTNIEEEKKRLNEVMLQLNGEITGLQQSMKKLGDENRILSEKVDRASLFVASEIRLSPVMLKNDKEQETNIAKKVSKLIVSFAVQNNINDYNNAEIFIIITQPDGKVLTPDVWESASPMITHTGERKSYTRKIKFEYLKSETKRLTFSLNADNYLPGNYTLQLYHSGNLIGQTSKVLN
ncbi:MAG TPA: hypothetical protein PKG90_02530 [Chitinophagaceae bacterium]|nr:hypothetical protein [Chitinophagaceae bacterium]